MIEVYVLWSEKAMIHYVGLTNDLDRRLKEHNQGKSMFTKAYRPWVIIYSEILPDYAQARKREKYLKSSAGKKFLIKCLNPGNRGSLPE